MSKLPGDPGYRAGWCIHYGYKRDGAPEERGPICAAGIDMKQWPALFDTARETARKNGLSLMDLQPCFLSEEGHRKPNAWPCACLRQPTPEEIAAHKTWRAQQFEKHAKVGPFVAKWRADHKDQHFAEIVNCPACDGRLHLSISRSNGHVHGKCETQGCVEWME